MKKILSALLFLACTAANAQFVTGQILTAAQLNAAFANVLATSGGTLTGPLTVPTVTVTGTLNAPNISISGGTIAGATITGGTINGTSIGAITPSTGAFTSISSTTPIAVASGGTGSATASGTALDNISGLSGTGFLTRTGAGAYSFQSATNGITLGNIAQVAANTVLANATASTANVAAFSMPGCSTSVSALNWTTSTGFTCNTGLITAATVSSTYATIAQATTALAATGGSISGVPISGSTGSFTTLAASSTVSGTGFSTYLASPPAIGGTVAAAAAFTTLTASSNDALLYQSTSTQSIANATPTTVTGWAKVSDRVNANFNASTGTFTAPATGYYQVSCQLQYASAAGVVGAFMGAEVVANGADVAFGQTWVQATGTTFLTVYVSTDVSLTAGQTLVIQAYQNSGSARALSGNALENYLSISRIP